MEFRWHWPSQAQLMREEFSKHRCPGQEWHRLLEATKRTVSQSFLCLVFVVSWSVMLAELSCVICGGAFAAGICESVCLCM